MYYSLMERKLHMKSSRYDQKMQTYNNEAAKANFKIYGWWKVKNFRGKGHWGDKKLIKN